MQVRFKISERPVYKSRWAQILDHSDSAAALFFAAHIPLAIAMYTWQALATVHAWGIALVTLWLATKQNRHPQLLIYAAAYVVGAEVMWRMCHAGAFWEMGKYTISFAFVLALVQMKSLKRHDLALLFFLLLMPSTLLTLLNGPEEFRWKREYLSFNLSGPFALAVSAWFFRNVRLTQNQFNRMTVAMLGPLVGIAAITVYATILASDLQFTDESNFVTSGGFGPNQVSAVLGMGALLAIVYILLGRPRKLLGFAMVLLTGLFSVQSAMTFSRGGLYCAGGALLLTLLVLIRDSGARSRLVWLLPLTVIVGVFFIAPRLNDFTGGALSNRYADADLTHRDSLVWADIALWQENVVYGLGPGMARDIRGNSPHTEFSRLLAEHGMWGLVSLVILVIMTLQAVSRAREPWEKGIALALVSWSLLFMLAYDMRVAAPSMLFGLSFARLIRDVPFPRRRYPEAPPYIPAMQRVGHQY